MENKTQENAPEASVPQVTGRKNQIERILKSESFSRQMSAYLGGDSEKVERLRATLLAICMSPDMAKWDPMTIVSCGVQVAQIGLSPLPTLKQVYFVAYKGKLQLQVGYIGWITLAERMGKAVKSHAIYKCDKFSHEVNGFDETFLLNANYEERKEDDPAWVMENLKGVMVLIKDRFGVVYQRFVMRKKLDQLRAASPSVQRNSFSPWTNWPAEMFMAKAIKYVISKTSVDERTAIAIQVDNDLEIKMREQNSKRGSEVAKEIQGNDFVDVEAATVPMLEDFNQETGVENV